MASKGGIRKAPYGAGAVSGSKVAQGSEYGAGKVARMRGKGERHPASEVLTRTGGTPRGRQQALTPDRKRTALMYGIG